ncbi:hypothetical protein [Rurimicrobium arvi]|uniref:hypothetical protein n=1 Tax=Rurimicrobium arvi TaxID=2049916 RepID=UPI0031DF0117
MMEQKRSNTGWYLLAAISLLWITAAKMKSKREPMATGDNTDRNAPADTAGNSEIIITSKA